MGRFIPAVRIKPIPPTFLHITSYRFSWDFSWSLIWDFRFLSQILLEYYFRCCTLEVSDYSWFILDFLQKIFSEVSSRVSFRISAGVLADIYLGALPTISFKAFPCSCCKWTRQSSTRTRSSVYLYWPHIKEQNFSANELKLVVLDETNNERSLFLYGSEQGNLQQLFLGFLAVVVLRFLRYFLKIVISTSRNP